MLFPSQHITSIGWQSFRLPFKRPYVTSAGRATFRRGLLISVKTETGLVGVGEASPVGPGSSKQVEEAIKALASVSAQLVGLPIDSTLAVIAARILPSCLRFGLETAFLDIAGKARGLPIASLLGTTPVRLPCNALISAASPAQAENLTRQALKEGFTALKLKISGATLAEDESLVSAVRQAAPRVKLRLDPNQAWNVGQAVESIDRLARYSIEYVEQPVRWDDISGLAEVRSHVPVPIAADESLNSRENLRRVLDASAADVFVLKAAQLGGVLATLDAAREVLKRGASVVVTTSLESGVGVAASAHIASVLPPTGLAHGLATGLLFKHDVIARPLLPVGGCLETPAGPGLGVELASGNLSPND